MKAPEAFPTEVVTPTPARLNPAGWGGTVGRTYRVSLGLRNGSGMIQHPRVQRSDGSHRSRGYWRANLRLIGVLLSVWAVVSLGFGVLLVEPLNRITLGSLPLGFWFAQQGSIYVFVVLIFVYAWRMDTLDRRFGVGE